MSSKNSNDGKKRDIDGLIFLNGTIAAEWVCKEIIRLNIENDIPSIQLIINSCGGYCSDGFAIIDIIEWSRIPVYTTGIGIIASMGLLIFMSGEKGKRVITPRTSVLSHRYFGGAMGNHSSLIAARKEQDLMHKRICDHYLKHTKINTEQELNTTLLRDVDTWLSPQECIEYGIVDTIQKDIRKINL
ncbi:ATP-dependent Clp protease proteolytic subunit [Candidatus Dependentiae bacterium]|nr:ATP-dependent Clp protease proteolytic subunit [Candidatus Dependentiae bacterium]